MKTCCLFFACVLLLAVSCDEEKSDEEIFLEKIGHTWTATSVEVDGTVVNGAFAGFALTLTTGKAYTTVNGNAPVWAASGTFVLQKSSSAAGFRLVRDDGVEIEVEQPGDSNLILRFHYEAQGGRSAGVTGNFTFEMSR